LRIVSGLSVSIEINFINAGLPRGAWLGVPGIRAQLNLTESLHGKATPDTPTFGGQRLDTITTSSELIAEHMEPAGLPAQHMWTKQPK
jgi:hypothetical protein